MYRPLLTRIYYGKNHPGRIHGVNRETGLTYCGIEPGEERFEGDPRGIGCDRCWSEARRLQAHQDRELAPGAQLLEHRLPAPAGVLVFQGQLEFEGAYSPPPKRSRPRLPRCSVCEDAKLEPVRLAAPGGGWKCGRGHGRIGGPEG